MKQVHLILHARRTDRGAFIPEAHDPPLFEAVGLKPVWSGNSSFGRCHRFLVAGAGLPDVCDRLSALDSKQYEISLALDESAEAQGGAHENREGQRGD